MLVRCISSENSMTQCLGAANADHRGHSTTCSQHQPRLTCTSLHNLQMLSWRCTPRGQTRCLVPPIWSLHRSTPCCSSWPAARRWGQCVACRQHWLLLRAESACCPAEATACDSLATCCADTGIFWAGQMAASSCLPPCYRLPRWLRMWRLRLRRVTLSGRSCPSTRAACSRVGTDARCGLQGMMYEGSTLVCKHARLLPPLLSSPA